MQQHGSSLRRVVVLSKYHLLASDLIPDDLSPGKKMQSLPIKEYRARGKYSSKAALPLSISNDQLA